MKNTIATWLYLIGTRERAIYLRKHFAELGEQHVMAEDEPANDPTRLLFGSRLNEVLYADPAFRPALDAWDTGEVSAEDIRLLALWIERGNYKGPSFEASNAYVASRASASRRAALSALRRYESARRALSAERSEGDRGRSRGGASHRPSRARAS